jgi:hypothetical protein
MDTPRLHKIRQHFPDSGLSDPAAVLRAELTALAELIQPGHRIVLAVGSRGIDNLPLIVSETARMVRDRGAHPFVVPAMGSHGGATAEGQREVLNLYGVREEMVGAPIRSSMEVVELPRGESPVPVFMDRTAWESDGVLLINRVKPHTDYHGSCESGLMKMAVIGLGKHEGAKAVHRYGIRGLKEMIAPAARQVLSTGRIRGGVALIENARHQTCRIRALRAHRIPEEEPALLELARENMPALPVEEADVLIIDRMGKDISGTGLDPNVIGRIRVPGQEEPDRPRIRAIMVTALSERSHGNAIGVGLADVITQALYDRIDRQATYENVVTSTFLERGKIPLTAPDDRTAFEIALNSCGGVPAGEERILRIQDTLNLEEVYVSEAVLGEMADGRHELIDRDVELFDPAGALHLF